MLQTFSSFFGRKDLRKGGPLIHEAVGVGSTLDRDPTERRQAFSKIFRWHLPDGQTKEPVLDAWHISMHHILGNRTHH